MTRKIFLFLILVSIFIFSGCTSKSHDLSDTTLTYFSLDQIQVNNLWNEGTDYVVVKTHDNLQEIITYQSPLINLQKYNIGYFNDKMIIIYWFENNQGIIGISINDALLEDKHLTITINVTHTLTMSEEQGYLFIEINKVYFNTVSIDVIDK